MFWGSTFQILTWKYSPGNSRHWATWVDGDKVGEMRAPSGCKGAGTSMIYTLFWLKKIIESWVYIYLFKFLCYTAAYSKSVPKSSILPPFQCARMLSSQSKTALSTTNPKQVPKLKIDKQNREEKTLCWQSLALWKRNFRQRIRFRYWKEDLMMDEQKRARNEAVLLKKMTARSRWNTKRKKKNMDDWDVEKHKLCSIFI